MTWRNPLALFGLASLLVPLLLHLLTQHRARVIAFPTLRFLPATRPVPAWSRRPGDLVLLVCRMVVLACVVMALAGPMLTSPSVAAANRDVARVVVVDTSARLRTAGATVDASGARGLAQSIADSARISRVVATTDPSSAIDAATSWLAQQRAGFRELVIVSDFRRSLGLDSTRLAAIPHDIGVRLVRTTTVVAPESLRVRLGRAVFAVDAAVTDDSTLVRYVRDAIPERASVTPPHATPPVIAGVDAEAELALRSVVQQLPRFEAYTDTDTDTDSASVPVMVRFVGITDWQEQRLRTVRITEPAHALELVRLQRDAQIASAAVNAMPVIAADSATASSGATSGRNIPQAASHAVIATNADGVVILDAAVDTTSGGARLVIFANVAPLSVMAATLLDVLYADGRIRPQDVDTAVLSDAAIGAMQRIANYASASSTAGHDLARWFWLLALTALVLETWLRRGRNGMMTHVPIPEPSS